MSQPENSEQIRRRLDELTALDSFPDFSRVYYELIAERIDLCPQNAPRLREVLAAHLERELRFHTQLRNLDAQDGVNVGDMVSLAEKHRISLQETISLLEALEEPTAEAQATAEMMVAECHYHLQEFDRVVTHLEKAIQFGADEPLLHFALGYNRYVVAEEAYTVLDEERQCVIITDAASYRSAMLMAVSAFEDGLSGGPIDPNLYWWIGTCLERAGFDGAAEHAFGQAKGVVAETRGGSDQPDAEMSWLPTVPADLPEISLEEIRRVRELLTRSYKVSDILNVEGT